MPYSPTSVLLTKSISRPVLIIFLVSLALFSLVVFTPHPISTLISLHTGFQNPVPSVLPKGDELAEIGADLPALPQRHLANATLFMLARNSDVDSAVTSVRELEDRFNHNRVSNIVSGPVHFGQIPDEHWYQPDWINETLAEEERDKMVTDGTIHGGSVPYRNMCRFQSGFFYRHPLAQNFRYYWRVEPGVHFHCDVNIDPFVYMNENNKAYGFTITLYEFKRTIESLWSTVHEFMAEHPEYVVQNNAMNFLSDNGGTDYNFCHFWSNFEIADMDFWRGEAYSAFFEYLDRRGGFYYERWGDAPVHSIAAALFAGTDRIHFFREIGYEHAPFTYCPAEPEIWERGRCACDAEHSTFSNYVWYSCFSKWDRLSRDGLSGRR